MKTAHYLFAFLACAAVSVGSIAVLQAQQEKAGAAPAAAAAPAVAGAPAAPADANFGFASLDDRFAYAVGFMQAQRFTQDPENKVEAEAFIKGFKAGLKGEDSSYAQGLLMGASAKRDDMKVNADVFADGIRASVKGEPGRLNEEQRKKTFEDFQAAMQAKQQAEMAKKQAEAAAKAAKANEGDAAYLAANAKKEGWKTTASGLQYKIVAAGEAVHPAAADIVKVHYEGKFTDGEVFDASKKHGPNPAEFPLNQVIKGWTEAVQLIGKGGKMEIALPAGLAYGQGGPRPGAAMLFSIELVDFKKAGN